MATTQQLLTAVNNMQRDVQEGLPVIPNNGNPGGAHNMPQQAPMQEQPAPSENPLAWLEPSPFMTNVKQQLLDQSERLANQIALQADEGRFNIGVYEGQYGAQMLNDAGVPIREDSPFVVLNPYGEGPPIPQMTQHNMMPEGTILPMRAVP